MSSYARNILQIIGTDEQVAEVLDFIKRDGVDDKSGIGTIDFGKITPMPKWVFLGNLGPREEQQYGPQNCWLEWSEKNWGTKWNASPVKSLSSGNTICFNTAWCGVPDLMSKLARIFPEVTLKYRWAFVERGEDAGVCEFQGVDVLSAFMPEDSSDEAIDLANEIWNYKG